MTAAEYSLLSDVRKRLRDPRFKFAEHSLDLEKLAWGSHLLLNSLRRRMAFLFDTKYFRGVLRSRKKGRYAGALLGLLRQLVFYYLEYAEFVWRHFGTKKEEVAV